MTKMDDFKGAQGASRDIFEIIHNRRSIRHFTDKPISDDILEKIMEAGIRAPFAAQLYSMIYTRDLEKMKKLRRLGIYLKTKVFITFFIDFRKLEKMIIQRGYTYRSDDAKVLWLGIQDAVLVAENVVLAAEAFGLGSVLLGAPPMYADLISEVLNVPDRVFPVVGLCLGYPDGSVETDVRPRFPLKYSAFEDSYKDLSKDEVKECMKSMDEGFLTQGYYIKVMSKVPLEKGKDDIDSSRYSWSEHISRKFSQGLSGGKEATPPLLEIIRNHGFNLD